MELKTRYAGTLQLKQLAERRLAEHGTDPDQTVAWSAAVAYFEDQLHQLQAQPDPSLDSDPEQTRAICLALNYLINA